MSDCEICGAEIRGKAQIISVGTSKLRVCSTCVRHGTVVVETKKAKFVQPRNVKKRLYEQMDLEIEAGQALEEDYGKQVRNARGKAGLKQEELAKKINEKQSLLRKIENDDISPSEEVMRKIKRVLKPFL
ncbi:putative transcription factor [Candidatus Methanophagaceae archaeon]|nr:putative transcription factor [Methanophagales archaeon]